MKRCHFRVLLLNTIMVLPLWASCPIDQPAVCPIDTQLPNGRWDLSQVTGNYELEGNEVFCEFLDGGFCDLADDYTPINGNLMIEKIGGIDDNYIDVDCDGNITGKGKELITGTIDKTASIMYTYPECIEPGTFEEPQDMSWDVTIDRTYDITGTITGNGQADLVYSNNSATIDIVGNFAFGEDCYWTSFDHSLIDFDISGDTENVILQGVFNPSNNTWQPDQDIAVGEKSWLDKTLHRFQLNAEQDLVVTLDPILVASGSSQPNLQLYNTYFIQDTVTLTQDIQYDSEPSTPFITNFTLQEPSQYIQSVNVDTQAIVTIDWRGQSPGEVEFTYGSLVETVPGADMVTWDFDAGESGDTIQAIAIFDNEESVPYTIATPKVALPPWAQTVSDWSGESGIEYEGNLNWPLSLESTQNLETLKLFAGLWGINGSITSDYDVMVFSNGSSGAGEMNTQAHFSFAGKSIDFQMQGPNISTLSCDELVTDGEGTINIPIPGWDKTLNPITAIPGLQPAVCSLSQFLCKVIQSIGLKASAGASLTGTGFYAGDSGDILWTGGSVSGSINAKVGAGISLPKPFINAAGVSISGGGTGCIGIQVAPSFQLNTLGGNVELNAQAHFIGLKASASQDWPFGDACATATHSENSNAGTPGWVPLDGHLVMTQRMVNNALQGVVIWSALDDLQSRPSGTIHYRFYDGTSDTWGDIHELAGGSNANNSPSAQFDKNGNLLIVYQSNEASIPTQVSELNLFTNAYELDWILVDPDTEQEISSGSLTSNALHDFGPEIIRDSVSELSLFWQRANGIEMAGTLADTVSIQTMTWDADALQWSNEEEVISDLSYTYGWSVAAYSDNTKIIGIIFDTDADYTTNSDRELFKIEMTNGLWSDVQQLTTNSINDDSVTAIYDGLGKPIFNWREDDGIKELKGNVAGDSFPLLDVDYLEGVGEGFNLAQQANQNDKYAMIWPQSNVIMLETNQRNQSTGSWEQAIKLIGPSEDLSQSIHSVSIENGVVYYGWASRSLLPSGFGFEDSIRPQFASHVAFDLIYADSFE